MSVPPPAAPTVDVDHRPRRDRLRDALAAEGLDALYVTHAANVRWLTGFTGSSAQLVVAVDRELDLFLTDGRYDVQAAAEVADLERRLCRTGADEAAVDRLAGRLGVLGFEAHRLTWEAAERLRGVGGERGLHVRPAVGHVERLRAVKDPHELAALRTACAVTDAAFAQLLDGLRPGLSERSIALQLESSLVDLGAEAPSFPSIVASGPNSARPHHQPTDRRLQPGDLLKVDFGARVAGYHADMTRTVGLGEPGQLLREVHAVVRAAQAVGIGCARLGTTVGEVDRVCRETVDAAGYGDAFVHGTGHGVGLEVHEWPTLAKEGRATLATGMTVTVEPGVYLAGTGGVRIEDTLAVTSSGPPEVLTRSPRELLIL
ncbi:MAG TPA: Xaa-Pro peptidase family protein [Nitriliruptorales bacterium]|nr:Xaa-Pro peptidase family protein [Nitriliruptorales bacterium]